MKKPYYTTIRYKYLYSILHLVTAELNSFKKKFSKSKMHYKKLENYKKYNFMSGIVQSPNYLHKLHKMCDKIGGINKNRKKIYKTVCPICYSVSNFTNIFL